MKAKASKFVSRFGYEIGIFAVLCVQALLNRNSFSQMVDDFYSYYLVDFSMGFNSRLLVGSLVNLLTKHPTAHWLDVFSVVVLFLTLFVVALLVGKIIKCADKKYRNVLLVFVLFFVSGSFTMYGFSRYFGMLDIYMFMFAVLAVVFSTNKYLRPFVPLLAFGGILVNYAFAVTYFPAVIGAAFYFAVAEKEKKSNFFIFLFTGVLSVAATYFFVFKAGDLMKITFNEMWQIMEQKSGIKFTYEDIRYYDMYFYGNSIDAEIGREVTGMSSLEMVKTIIQIVTGQMEEYYTVNVEGIVSICAILSVIFSGFWAIWIMCAKNAQTKSKKFVFVCFLLATLFVPLSWLTSTDYSRMAQAGVINQFLFAFLMFVEKDEAFQKTLEQLKQFFKGKEILLAVWYLVYASCFQRGWSV